MSKNYPPAYLRYLRARLRNLTRPGFWGTALVLSVIGLIFTEYWTNPNFLNISKQNEPVTEKSINSGLSDEDKAIAADIDNLPVLFYDYKQAQTKVDKAEEPLQAAQKKILKSSQSIQKKISQDNSRFVSNSTRSIQSPEIKNPFLSEANNLLQLKSLKSDRNKTLAELNQSYSILGTLNQQTNPATTDINQNTTLLNPLQVEINRLSSINQQNINNSPKTQIIPNNSLTQNLTQNYNNSNLSTPSNSNFTNQNIYPSSASNFGNNQFNQIGGLNSINSSDTNQPQNFYTNYSGTNLNEFNSTRNQSIIQPQYTYNQNNQNNQPSIGNLQQSQLSTTGVPTPSPIRTDPGVYNSTSPNSFNNIRPNTRQNIYNNNQQITPNQYSPNTQSSYQSPYSSPQYNYSSTPKLNNTNQIKINGRSYSYP